ncbi:Myb transcription factor protein [Rutstroemia sp. NJR-2017a BVV2]|nr:Myb transcription factor protein [Rutstroemia sp. NJR-2017a BVV2]
MPDEEIKPGLTSEEPRSPSANPSAQAGSDEALTMDESALSSTTKSKKNRKKNRKIGGGTSVAEIENAFGTNMEGSEDMDTTLPTSYGTPTPARGGKAGGGPGRNVLIEGGWEKRKEKRHSGVSQNGETPSGEKINNSMASPTGDTAGSPSIEEHVSSPNANSTKKKKKKKKKRTSEAVLPEDESGFAVPVLNHSEGSPVSTSVAEPLEKEQEQPSGAFGLDNTVSVENEEALGAEKKKMKRKTKSKTNNVEENPDSAAIEGSKGNKAREREMASPSRSEQGTPAAMNKSPNVADDMENGDASSAALLNDTTSARPSSLSPSVQLTDVAQSIPSAKALGKLPSSRENSAEQPSKKRKRPVDSDSRNGDLRSMWSHSASDDNSRSNSRLSMTSYARDLFANHHDREGATASNGTSPVTKAAAISSQANSADSATGVELASARSNSKKSPKSSQGTKKASNNDEETAEDPPPSKPASHRKRRLPVDDSPDEPTAEAPRRKKTKQSATPLPKGQSSSSKKAAKIEIKHTLEDTADSAQRRKSLPSREPKGKLSQGDTVRVSAAVEAYRNVTDMTQQTLNEIIQGNALSEAGKKLWDFIMDEVPDLPKRNVQSWTRRAFHNYAARGTWTPEQDEELREAFERNPKKWAIIGAELNRLPDDCRDRWRNYLSVTNLALGPWQQGEERQLREAVKKCIDLIHEDRRGKREFEHDDDDSYHEKDIDWMKVSELMDSSRSHLQCYRKWNRIKTKEQATTDDLMLENIVMDDSWGKLKSAQDGAKLRAHEKLQFLQAIRDSGHSKEKDIDWKKIDEQLDRNHEVMELRICLRGLKQNIPGHEKMKLQNVIARLIAAFEKSAPHEPDGFPDLPFESIGPKRQSTKAKPSPRPASAESSNSKSKLKNRMLKQGEPQGTPKSLKAKDKSISSAKAHKSPKSSSKQGVVSNKSEERVVDSDSEQDIPTSAQKPQETKTISPRRTQADKEGSSKKRRGVKTHGQSEENEQATSIAESQHEESRTLGNSAIDEYAIEDDSEEPEAPEREPSLSQSLEESSEEDKDNETPRGRQFMTQEDASVDEEMRDAELPEVEDEITSDNELQIPATPEYMLEGERGSVDLDRSRDIARDTPYDSSDDDKDMEDIQARK